VNDVNLTEMGSGMDRARSKARRLLADPGVPALVAGHRDRLGRINTELAGAAFPARAQAVRAALG